jgi:hypothetical protein
MAVTFDAVGPSAAGASAAAAASLTWAHTVGAGASIIAGASVGKSPDTPTITATYAGAATTAGTAVHTGAGTAGYLRLFTLLTPATGANNVVVTLSTGTADLTGGSISATGVGSFKAQYSATGNSATASAVSAGSASGNLIAAFVADGDGTTSATAPSTSRFIKNLNAATGGGNSAGATSPGTGSNVTTAWTVATSTWAVIGVELLASAAAVPNPPPRPRRVSYRRRHAARWAPADDGPLLAA